MSKSLKKSDKKVLKIKNSLFIPLKFKVENKSEIKKILNELKIKFRDSSHICYAYLIDKGAFGGKSDDGEPKNSAGKALFRYLSLKKLNNILLVVVRYYGGTKLGLGQLSKAYVQAINQIF